MTALESLVALSTSNANANAVDYDLSACPVMQEFKAFRRFIFDRVRICEYGNM